MLLGQDAEPWVGGGTERETERETGGKVLGLEAPGRAGSVGPGGVEEGQDLLQEEGVADFQKIEDLESYTFTPFKFEEVPTRGARPHARSGHRVVCSETAIYSFGGYNPETTGPHRESRFFPLFQELWKLNFATGRWKQLPLRGDCPDKLASHCANRYDQYLLVYGGTSVPFGHESSNELLFCDLNSLEWHVFPTQGVHPQRMYGQGLVRNGMDVYIIGGTTGHQYCSDVHHLDLKTGTWTSLPFTNYPEPRYRHEIVFHNNILIVFGGGTNMEAYGLIKLPAYDLQKKNWTVIATQGDVECGGMFPAPRRCLSLTHVGQFVYICGGLGSQYVAYDDLWQLDLTSFRWRRMPTDLPQSLYFHSADVTPEGKMYVFGGVTGEVFAPERTNSVYSIWLKIPSLKEMCWEAVLHYAPWLDKVPSQNLVEAGVPQDLANRVGDFLADVG
ncbi:unnamed protein product [Darwinula stevensoni]|uniref:Kelch domain-containing protein 10 n=1 Tax=Darwinula stevensoni TaxID=69355 RepID=A0A7R9FS15_9CRUS|nr:unnamed protein product [Darwinula stevensoni]CAG0902344.1 unnamed protein product [Darwinula stevensoni]